MERAVVLIGVARCGLPALPAVPAALAAMRSWATRQGIPNDLVVELSDGDGNPVKVADVFEPKEIEKVTASTPLRDIVQMIAHSRQDYFPVTDDDGRFVGMLSVHDVRQCTFDESVYRLAIAADIMSSPPVVVRPGDDLHKALETFDSIWIDELPVVDADDPDKVLGQLRRRAINRAYTKKLKELRALQERQGE